MEQQPPLVTDPKVWEVGKYYEIPLAVLKPHNEGFEAYSAKYQIKHPFTNDRFFGMKVVPLMQDKPHNDFKVIGFEYDHYHIDFRFLPNRNYDIAIAEAFNSRVLKFSAAEQAVLAKVLLADAVEKVITGRRLMRRQYAEFPLNETRFVVELEAEYYGQKLKKGQICPHQGVSLGSMPADKHNCKVCPGHGLRWNIQTGDLVTNTAGHILEAYEKNYHKPISYNQNNE